MSDLDSITYMLSSERERIILDPTHVNDILSEEDFALINLAKAKLDYFLEQAPTDEQD